MGEKTREKRVVVTGLGVISPVGIGKKAFWESLLEGKSGIDKVTRFDPTPYPSKIAAEVRDFEPDNFFDRKEAKRMDRFTQFGLAAAKMAIDDAGVSLEKVDAERVGVIIGSGVGGIETLEEQMRVLIAKGPGRVSPFLIPMMINNMVAGQVAIQLKVKGPSFSVVTACASGATAVGEAFRMLQRGDLDIVLAGGTEAPITEIAFAGFCSMRAMSTRNDEPSSASRPFDKNRDGFVIGEGAGIMVLETLDHALQRDARIYCELVGYGATSDGYHITAPHPEGEGAARAIMLALEDAHVLPQDVDYINAHGTSTELNDKIETLAIKRVFGDYAYRVPVSSIKSMIGHLMGAAGAVGAISTVLSITTGWIPPTINYQVPDPECDLDYVPNHSREKEINLAICNAFGFGGHNAVLVFKRYVD
ncbi:MAG: beta-ketoacyl-ACP synthase II [Thermacetogeniaceae bacterium]